MLLAAFFLLLIFSAAVSLWAVENRKADVLPWIEAAILLVALLLLGASLYIVRAALVSPLMRLVQAAGRLEQGNYQEPVPQEGAGEIRRLAEALEETRLRLQASYGELEALQQISQGINSRLDLNRTLQIITEKAKELLDCEAAFLCLIDEQGRALNLQGVSGPKESVSSGITLTPEIGEAPAGAEAPSGIERPAGSVRADCTGDCTTIAKEFRRSQLSAPLILGERRIGSLCVGSTREDAFSEEAHRLLERLAALAAIAIENTRLYVQVEQMTALTERQRMAAELHEGLEQTLNYLALTTSQASEAASARDNSRMSEYLLRLHSGIAQATTEAREAIARLRVDLSPAQTIQERLVDLVREFSQPGEPVIEVQAIMDQHLAISREQTDQIMQVAREALSNAIRHANASHISLGLDYNGLDAVLTIEDDGQGFDVDASEAEGSNDNHFGLSIIQARAARLGGKISIRSTPGQGTRLVFTWPIKRG